MYTERLSHSWIQWSRASLFSLFCLVSRMSEEDKIYRTWVLRGTSHPVAPWGFSWTVGYSVFPNSCVKDCILSSQMQDVTMHHFCFLPSHALVSTGRNPGHVSQGATVCSGPVTRLSDSGLRLYNTPTPWFTCSPWDTQSHIFSTCQVLEKIHPLALVHKYKLNRNQICEVHPGRKSAVPLPSVPPYLQVTGA